MTCTSLLKSESCSQDEEGKVVEEHHSSNTVENIELAKLESAVGSQKDFLVNLVFKF